MPADVRVHSGDSRPGPGEGGLGLKDLKASLASRVGGVRHSEVRSFCDDEEASGGGSRPASALRALKSSVTEARDGIRKPSKGILHSWFTSKVRQDGVSSRDGSSKTSAHGEDVPGQCGSEEGVVAKMILGSVYARPLSDEETIAVLSTCREVAWLVECYCQNPVPPGWRKSKVAPGDTPLFACEASGDVTETAPHLEYYARLAEYVIHAYHKPELIPQLVQWMQHIAREAQTMAAGLQATWTGPHLDPSSGAEYFFCKTTNLSSWENPCTWIMFVACVAERLLQSEALSDPTGSKSEATRDTTSRDNQGKDAAVPSGARSSATTSRHNQHEGSAVPSAALPSDGQGNPWSALEDLEAMQNDSGQPKGPTNSGWAAVEEQLATQTAEKAMERRQQTHAAGGIATGNAAQGPGTGLATKASPMKTSGGGVPPPPPVPAAPAAPPARSSLSALPPPPSAPAAPAAPRAAKPATGNAAAAVATPPSTAPHADPGGLGSQRAEIVALAARLRSLMPPPETDGTGASVIKLEQSAEVCEVLSALERIPATLEDLKESQLGVLTQPLKDCSDPQVRALVKRLRKAWKDALRS